MLRPRYLMIAVIAVVMAVFVGYRELRTAATPAKKDAAHGHSHGHADGPPKKGEAKGKDDHDHAGHAHGPEEGGEGFIKFTPEQMQAAGVDLAPAASGTLVKEIAVPGRIAINADRQAKIVPRLAGTVAKINKRMGEPVAENEVLAVLESRDMADAKADYLAASRGEELARSIYEREERLWKQKVTAEQDYLSARNAHQSAKIKLDAARQRLYTIGLSRAEIQALPKAPEEVQRFYEIRSPIAGRVTSRNLVLGQSVGTDKEIFTVAELSTVWVEIAIAPNDLAFAKEGQEVRVQNGSQRSEGKIVALSPVIDPDTRSAKAVAEVDNRAGPWKLGDFAAVQLIGGTQEVNLIVPRDALQTIKGTKAVFVSQGTGFKMRPVTTGREDSLNVEILSGLEFGETIATKNTFILKAELGKAEAEHQH
jgi:cobalt-zinc-cadmium efflux system membrane fusion protein